MRWTNDRRILIRQNIHFQPSLQAGPALQAKVREGHQRLFDIRFPKLRGFPMEHTWTGLICLSRNGAPGFGQVAPNIRSAVCQNAVGVAKGTISGRMADDPAGRYAQPWPAQCPATAVLPGPWPARAFCLGNPPQPSRGLSRIFTFS